MKKPKTKKDMIAYLKGHFRYDTMNSWNAATSFAANVKIHRLNAPTKLKSKAYEFTQHPEAYYDVNWIMDDFAERHEHRYQMGFNGRSGGYIVLYTGGKKNGQVYSSPGKSFPEDTDYENYSKVDLQWIVDVVWDFDQTIQDCITAFLEFVETHKIVDGYVSVPRRIVVSENEEEDE